MNHVIPFSKTLIFIVLCLGACDKKPDTSLATTPDAQKFSAPDTPPATSPTPTNSPSDAERAQLQHKIDLAKLAAQYIADSKAQWASSATSGPGAEQGKTENAIGAPDEKLWFAKGVVGIDWLEVQFPKPVSATEVRVAVTYGIDTISQLELQDTSGNWHTVWSGISEVKNNDANLTWWVRSFDKTPYSVKSAKISMAAISSSRAIDAVQLVGE